MGMVGVGMVLVAVVALPCNPHEVTLLVVVGVVVMC